MESLEVPPSCSELAPHNPAHFISSVNSSKVINLAGCALCWVVPLLWSQHSLTETEAMNLIILASYCLLPGWVRTQGLSHYLQNILFPVQLQRLMQFPLLKPNLLSWENPSDGNHCQLYPIFQQWRNIDMNSIQVHIHIHTHVYGYMYIHT